MARTIVHALVCRSLFPLDALVVPLQVSATQVGEHDLESRTDMPSNECRVVNIRSCARCFGRRVPSLWCFKSWCCVQCVSNVASQAFEAFEHRVLSSVNIRTPRSKHHTHSNVALQAMGTFERRVLRIGNSRTSRYKHRVAPSRASSAAFATRCSRVDSSIMF